MSQSVFMNKLEAWKKREPKLPLSFWLCCRIPKRWVPTTLGMWMAETYCRVAEDRRQWMSEQP